MTAFDSTKRHLGRGLFAHPLGVNCGAVAVSDDPQQVEVSNGHFLDGLRRAVELGANLLDTADCYGAGHAERMLGRLLREHPDREHLDQRLLTSSKVGRIRGSAPHAYAGRHIHHQFQQTLENLYTEKLDLYTLDSWDFGPQDGYLGSAIEQMCGLRDVGAVRAIGMRGPYVPYGATAVERDACAARFLHLFRIIRPNVVWTRFNALTPVITLDGEDLFAFTARHGAGVILAAPLAHGLLTGRAPRNAMLPPGSANGPTGLTSLTPEKAMRVTAGLQTLHVHFGNEPGTLTRLALLSCLQKADHCAAVVGFTGKAQLEESFGCLSGPALTTPELEVIDQVYAQIRTDMEEQSQHRTPQPVRT
ncbi:aldo/keto reductase (plasmid) [Streptomyces sp. AM 4-1-1]|uniref:aldo/keto reductase n=1 Tax=Streptomyces sp. AM 4-1-1 TaxID=3028710 RepID=UPI0023B95AC7|nr:aldo/keto reductase [Streptomyces sp. AM 4-1-1]WEH37883.1 aldo/keto reductase [Streptomyces sp. AM 4-1-1]